MSGNPNVYNPRTRQPWKTKKKQMTPAEFLLFLQAEHEKTPLKAPFEVGKRWVPAGIGEVVDKDPARMLLLSQVLYWQGQRKAHVSESGTYIKPKTQTGSRQAGGHYTGTLSEFAKQVWLTEKQTRDGLKWLQAAGWLEHSYVHRKLEIRPGVKSAVDIPSPVESKSPGTLLTYNAYEVCERKVMPALLFSRLLRLTYHWNKNIVYQQDVQLAAFFGVSIRQIENARAYLKEVQLIETKLKRVGGRDRAMHYWMNIELYGQCREVLNLPSTEAPKMPEYFVHELQQIAPSRGIQLTGIREAKRLEKLELGYDPSDPEYRQE